MYISLWGPCCSRRQCHHWTGRTSLQIHCRQPSLSVTDPIATLIPRLVFCTVDYSVGARTVEIRGSHERYMDSEVAVVRRAIKTKIYSKRHGCPCRIILPTIKAYLGFRTLSAIVHKERSEVFPTLFAGLVFSFSNIFCDCDFVAMAAILADLRRAIRYTLGV
jgi:hypothetical protein